VRLVTSEPALRGEYLKVQALIQYSLAEAIGLRMGFKAGGSMFPRILAAAVTAAIQSAMERWLHADPPTALAPLIGRALQQLADGMREVLAPE
ncbi:MAG: TetR family transcriptional regulator, partial [Actinobacteria bacterium]|nr:TetR family transcriptional regulator [Actinomycetota bacterium]